MRVARPATTRPPTTSPPPSTSPPPALSEAEKEAQRLEELQRLHSAIVAQWQSRKHRAVAPAFPPPSSTTSPSASSGASASPFSSSSTSLSLHPHSSPVVRFKTGFRNTILSVFVERGWAESGDEVEWDVHWTSKEWTKGVLPKIHLFPHQRINHFRNYYELTRKDLLIKNLKRRRNALLKEGRTAEAALYNFFPDTFNLPSEYLLFVDTFRRGMSGGGGSGGGGSGADGTGSAANGSGSSAVHPFHTPCIASSPSPLSNSWIMKPIGSSQGKGIFLIDKLSQLADWAMGSSPASLASSPSSAAAPPTSSSSASATTSTSPATTTTSLPASSSSDDSNSGSAPPVSRYIVQRYLSSPLLIGGKKFDLRVYVLVVSYHPLVAYMHRQGFARFSSIRYHTGRSSLSNSLVHLTNVAIQKHGPQYDEVSGGKWDVQGLRRYLLSSYPPAQVLSLFANLTTLVTHSLLAVQPVITQDPHCFELYGYDALIDSHLKPWCIEVNASPSLSANTRQDEQLKKAMLHDTFHALEYERWRKERGRRRSGGADRDRDKDRDRGKPVESSSGGRGTSGTGSGGREVWGADGNGGSSSDDERWGRVGGFDLLCDERGIRQDREGRPLNCLGMFVDDRQQQLRAMWRRMRSLDELDQQRDSATRAHDQRAQKDRQQRDKRRAG